MFNGGGSGVGFGGAVCDAPSGRRMNQPSPPANRRPPSPPPAPRGSCGDRCGCAPCRVSVQLAGALGTAVPLRKMCRARGVEVEGSRPELVRRLGLRAIAAQLGATPKMVLQAAGISESAAREAGFWDESEGETPLPMPFPEEDEEEPDLPPDGWPASPPYRWGNWNFEASTYTIAPNDTLAGLARLYLGAPQRWKEIWTPNRGQYPNPDKVPVGAELAMPLEAKERALSAMNSGAPSAPSTTGKRAPVPVPGEDPNAPVVPGAGLSPNAKVALGVGAGVLTLGALGAAVYAMK